MTGRLRFILISLLTICSLSAVAEARVLTIDAAVAEALQYNEDYRIARSEIERAESEIQRATSDAYPHLNLGSTYTRNLMIPEVVFGDMVFKLGTENQIDVGLTLTQPIWQGGKVVSAIKIARTYRKYTQEAVREAEADVTFGVRQAFLGVILSRDVVNVYRDALAAAELNLDMVQKMRSQGVVSEYELLRAQVEVANLRPQLLQSQNQTELSLQSLRNLLSVESSDTIVLEYSFDTTQALQSLNLANLTDLAIKNRGLVRRQDYLREMTGRAISIAKAEGRPKFDFVSQYGWRYQADNFKMDSEKWSPSWLASISLSYPIFNGFATKASVRRARVDKFQADLTFEKTVEQVRLEVQDAFLRYFEATERLGTQRLTIQQAEEGLRIARIRYQNGVGTQLEVLSSESALTQAQTNFVQATHDTALAAYRLLRVTGMTTFEELKEQ